MNREYHKWWSDNLQRDMELLVFGHAGAKVLVFPTREGRFFEYEKLRMIETLRHKSNRDGFSFTVLTVSILKAFTADGQSHQGGYRDISVLKITYCTKFCHS